MVTKATRSSILKAVQLTAAGKDEYSGQLQADKLMAVTYSAYKASDVAAAGDIRGVRPLDSADFEINHKQTTEEHSRMVSNLQKFLAKYKGSEFFVYIEG